MVKPILLFINFLLINISVRSACDFYSRANNTKTASCEWCIKQGIDTKSKCVYKPMSDWCVSFDEALPLMCAGNGGEWFKIHIYECDI